MIKMSKIIHEIEVGGLPSEKLLNWFLNRVDHTFIFFDTETNGLPKENGAIQPAIMQIVIFNQDGNSIFSKTYIIRWVWL